MNKTITAENAPAAVGPYCHAKLAGNTLYTSGQLGLIPATGELPQGVEAIHTEHVGRVYTYIIRGTAEEVEAKFKPLSPLFMEALPLTLEEIFIYEMGGEDYAVRDIAL